MQRHWFIVILSLIVGGIVALLATERLGRFEELRGAGPRGSDMQGNEGPDAVLSFARLPLAARVLEVRRDNENLTGTGDDPEGVTPLSVRVSGTVVLAPEFLPVMGVEVRVWQGSLTGVDGLAPVVATTNEIGAFSFELERFYWPPGALCSAEVRVVDGERLFLGSIVLEQDCVLVVPEYVTLHGVITGQASRRAVRVRFEDETSGQPFLVGRAKTDGDGRFECRVGFDVEPRFLRTSVVLEDGQTVIRQVSVADLQSRDGAQVEIDTRELTIAVLNFSGEPLEGAAVRLSGGNSKDAYSCVTTTNGDGEVTLLTMGESLEYCVGLADHNPATGYLDLGGGSHHVIHLSEFHGTATVKGSVRSPDGTPFERAFVSLAPRTDDPELGVAASFSTYSGPDGRFSIQSPEGLELVLHAYGSPHGVTAPRFVHAGDERVELRLPASGAVRVTVENCLAPPMLRQSRIEWAIASVYDKFEDSGNVAGLPVTFDELPRGDYNVYLFSAGLGFYAEGLIEVLEGETSGFTLLCSAPSFVTGRVIDGNGKGVSGCMIRRRARNWPSLAINLWGMVHTDEFGDFRMMVGSRSESVPVDIIDAGVVVHESRLSVERSHTITLP